MSRTYKNHIIDPKAYELAEQKGWTSEVYVYREHGSFGTDSRFIAQDIHASRDEAIEAAIALAKRQVDLNYDDSLAIN